MLPLEMQGWDSGIMARAVFSLKGWQNVAFSVKKPRIKWRWLDSAELGALTEAGRKPSVNEKQFSLELLDLSLILNVTCRGTGSCPCNVASCGSLWCCLQVNLRAAGPRGKSCCPAPPSRAGIFTNPSPFLRFSTSSFFFFFSVFNHFPGWCLQLAGGKQNRICYWLLGHLFRGLLQVKSY